MRLRLVIDHTVALLNDWYRLEEWNIDSKDWQLLTSGYEAQVRAVYNNLRKSGAKETVIEEVDV
jgi:hypothetical protein